MSFVEYSPEPLTKSLKLALDNGLTPPTISPAWKIYTTESLRADGKVLVFKKSSLAQEPLRPILIKVLLCPLEINPTLFEWNINREDQCPTSGEKIEYCCFNQIELVPLRQLFIPTMCRMNMSLNLRFVV